MAKTLFDADVESDLEGIGRAMDVTVRMFTRTMTPWGPWLNRLPLPSNFQVPAQGANGCSTRSTASFASIAKAANRGDLLSVLIRARDTEGDDGPMSAALLRDESHTIFTAGHETTANALTFALYLLAKNPAVEKKLHEELDTVLGGRAVAAQDVEKLEYARMVIAEAMRLYPPAWAIGRGSNTQKWRSADTSCPPNRSFSLVSGRRIATSEWFCSNGGSISTTPRRSFGGTLALSAIHPSCARTATWPWYVRGLRGSWW